MIKTLDILDQNIIEAVVQGIQETSISMPVIAEHDGRLCLVSFCWSTNKKQRNIPKPTHMCITPLQGGVGFTKVEKIPDNKVDDVIGSRAPNWWTMRKISQDMDDIIEQYNTTGNFPTYKYLAYLENMLPFYCEDFYPIFAAINNPIWNIDILKEALKK